MQTIFQTHRKKTIHLLFWLVYFSFFFYQISSRPSTKQEEIPFQAIFINALSHTLFLVAVAYANYFFTLPRYFIHKNGMRYAAEFTLLAVLILALYIPIKRYLADGYTHQEQFYYSIRFVMGSFVTCVLVSAFVASLRFFMEWQELEEQKSLFKNEKLTAELKFLRNQINPHFLFNTLNNLYSLAYTQSPKTTEVISRLSQMMRYMVYDCNHDTVSLSKEIEYIENYISLEKLRLNETVPIEFKVTGTADGIQIMPLLLIPFLENSFKHGVSNGHASWIKAELTCQSNAIRFHVANSKMHLNGSAASSNSGVGLENVKKRLAINYPGKHKMEVKALEDQFVANLEVQIQS
jgi:two-component system, LytTR family, sensor histidine kinase AlgZ